MRAVLPLFAGLAALSLGGCTLGAASLAVAGAGRAMADVQLFCQVGGLVRAMAAPAAPESRTAIVPIVAKGASPTFIESVCAVVGGEAVPPPSAPEAVPVLVVPAHAVPLKS